MIFVRLALLVGSIMISLAIVEIGLRLVTYGGIRGPAAPQDSELRMPHPTRGWTLAPGFRAVMESSEFEAEVTINSRGLRDVEHSLEPPGDRRRIVVLGDSFMEADQVALESSFTKRLQSRLDRTDVINLGVGGYGTTQEWLALQEEGLLYRPDLVLLAFYFNDLHNNSRLLESWLWGERSLKVFGRPYARIDASGDISIEPPDPDKVARWLAGRSIPDQRQQETPLLALRRIRLLPTMESELDRHDPNVWLGPLLAHFEPSWSSANRMPEAYADAWEEAWAVTERVLMEIGLDGREAGAEVLVFSVPARYQVEAESQEELRQRHPGLRFDVGAMNRRLEDVCRRSGLAFVDLLPVFEDAVAAGEGPFFFQRVDHHWNQDGHALAAQEIANQLVAHETEGSGIRW